MGDTNAERFAKRQQERAQKMGAEEQQAGAFHALREGYHKMLLSKRHFFTSDKGLFDKATKLATMDYMQRVDDMRVLYIAMNGDDRDFNTPWIYKVLKANMNPLNAAYIKENEEAGLRALLKENQNEH